MSESRKLKTKRAVADEFDVTTRTVDRWHLDEKLSFPRPIVINGRCYYDAEEIELFKLRCAKRQCEGEKAAA